MSDLEKYSDKSPDVNVYHKDADSYGGKHVHEEGQLQRKLKTRHIAMIR
jgi:amino acid permease